MSTPTKILPTSETTNPEIRGLVATQCDLVYCCPCMPGSEDSDTIDQNFPDAVRYLVENRQRRICNRVGCQIHITGEDVLNYLMASLTLHANKAPTTPVTTNPAELVPTAEQSRRIALSSQTELPGRIRDGVLAVVYRARMAGATKCSVRKDDLLLGCPALGTLIQDPETYQSVMSSAVSMLRILGYTVVHDRGFTPLEYICIGVSW